MSVATIETALSVPAEQIAWAAGLFEGEGCITSHAKGQKVALRMASTDEDVIRRFHAIVCCGKIGMITKRHSRRYRSTRKIMGPH